MTVYAYGLLEGDELHVSPAVFSRMQEIALRSDGEGRDGAAAALAYVGMDVGEFAKRHLRETRVVVHWDNADWPAPGKPLGSP